jgi:hypothetical protein
MLKIWDCVRLQSVVVVVRTLVFPPFFHTDFALWIVGLNKFCANFKEQGFSNKCIGLTMRIKEIGALGVARTDHVLIHLVVAKHLGIGLVLAKSVVDLAIEIALVVIVTR